MVNCKTLQTLVALLGLVGLAGSAIGQVTRHQCSDNPPISSSAIESLSIVVPNSSNCGGSDTGDTFLASYELPGCRGCRHRITFNYGGTVEISRSSLTWENAPDSFGVGIGPRYGSTGTLTWVWHGGATNTNLPCSGTTYDNRLTAFDYRGGDSVVLGYITRDGLNHSGFSTWINSVSVQTFDEHGDIVFDVDRLPPDGESRAFPRLTNQDAYPSDVLEWMIVGESEEQTLGCTINTETGEIKAGEVPGKIIVRAYNSEQPACFIEKELQIGCEPCETDDCLVGGTAKVGSIELLITAGKATFGDMAGVFRIKEEFPSAALSTPQTLKYFIGGMSTNEVQVLKTNDYIRQVFTPQTLANVVSNSALEYQIDFYAPGDYGTQPTNGLFPISGSPFTTWLIKNPNGGSSNQLSVVEISGNRTNSFDYAWDGTVHGWELTDDNGNRKQKRWSTTNGVLRTETYLVRNATNQVKYQEVKTFETFAWGEELVKQVIGTGSMALTNTYSYYTNSADTVNYSRLHREVEPGGKWTQYTYDFRGRIETVISQFLNSPIPASEAQAWTNRVTEIINYDDAVETLTYLKGNQTSWTLQLFATNESRIDIQRDQLVDPPYYTLTESRWTYQIEPFIGLPQKTHHEDGTWTFFYYANSVDGQFRTNTVDRGRGSASSATSVIDGARTVTVLDQAGNTISEKVYDIASGLLTSSAVTVSSDAFGRPLTIQYLDETTETYAYGCCGLESSTDREGITSNYDYDGLKRRFYINRGGIATREEFDARGRLERRVRIGRDSSEIVLESSTYDDADRLTSSTQPSNGSGLNRTTTYSVEFDGNGHLVKTTTFPDGGTEIRTFYPDGSILSISGTAAYPRKYEYGVDVNGRFTKEIRIGSSGEETEWTKRYSDALDRPWAILESDNNASTSYFYADTGKLSFTFDFDDVMKQYFYNAKGELDYISTDVDGDGFANNLISLDRFSRTVSDVISTAYGVVLRTRSYVWPTNNSNAPLLTRTVEQTADGLRSWEISFGLTNETRIHYTGNGNKTITNIAPDGSYAVTQFTNGFRASVTDYSAGDVVLTSESYSYDSHGRPRNITDLRNGTATLLFNDSDKPYSITTPQPGSGLSAQTTTFDFDEQDRIWRENLADGTHKTNEFYFTGNLFRTHGSRQYPVEFTYDSQGRKKTMTTWQDHAGQNGVAVTAWNYDPQRGWLNSVRDNSNQGETYTRTPSGKLLTHTVARGITITNGYNPAGELTTITPSDTATPKLAFVLDRLGNPTNITQTLAGQFTNATALTRNIAGQVTHEAYTTGILNAFTVTNGFDSLLRRYAVAVDGYGMTASTFSYGDASRLLTVSNDVNSATYAYVANSDLVQTTTFKNSGVTRLTVTRSHDSLERLTSISSGLASFAYQYNDANQRTSATLSNGSFWLYDYDSLGQLTSGKRYWPNGTPVMGQQFEYKFDDIGNRTTNKWGGTEFGTGLRAATYSPNLLNQYTSRTVPGSFDIIGDAHSDALVTVNFKDSERHGDYFWKELTADNSSAPVLVSITNIAVLLNGTNADIVSTNIGSILVPKASDISTFDLDGNLTSNSLFTNTWNGWNQVASIESQITVPAAARQKLNFVYDHYGRRIRKIVLGGWNGTSYTTSYTNLFLYNGYRLLARFDGSGNLLQSFVWVGNTPLSITDFQSGTAGTYFYCLDGNRNIVALTSAADGSKAAEYNYGPFGNIIGMTGLMAYANPLRFSCEYYDDETDLVYYLFRYYEPETGRWWSRDPIGEEGGLNLSGFLNNNPVGRVDAFGLKEVFDDDTFADAPGILGGRKGTITVVNGVVVHGTFLNQAEKNLINYELTGEDKYLEKVVELIEDSPVLTPEMVEAGVGDPLGASLSLLGKGLAGASLGALKSGQKICCPSPQQQSLRRVGSWIGGSRYNLTAKYNITERNTDRRFVKLKKDIQKHGLQNKTIEYVNICGERYILVGNQRFRIARQTGIGDQLQFKEVKLPYRGFKTEEDVLRAAAEAASGL